jgi:hypothetical protein
MKNLIILLVAAALVSPLAAEDAPKRVRGKGLLAAVTPKTKDEKKDEKKAEPKKAETAEKAAEPKKTENQTEFDRELAKRLAAAKTAAGGKELSYKEKAAIRKTLQTENAKKK